MLSVQAHGSPEHERLAKKARQNTKNGVRRARSTRSLPRPARAGQLRALRARSTPFFDFEFVLFFERLQPLFPATIHAKSEVNSF